jgi:O-antigen ligase
LRVLLENGIPGIVLLVIFFIWLAIKGLWCLWLNRKSPGLSYMVIAWVSYVAFLPMGTFIDTLHWRFLWIIAGVLSASVLVAFKEGYGEAVQS